MPSAPAAPPVQSPPPLSLSDSGRRILWIIGLYRAVSAALLLGMALLLDLKILTAGAPNPFATAAGLYFVFGLGSFWWIQRDPLPLSLSTTQSLLFAGDVAFVGMAMVAAGASGGPLPILLFPQLAASGWLLRTRTAFFHAALASVTVLGIDLWHLFESRAGATQTFQTGVIGLGYFATVGIAVALGRYT